MLSRKIKGLRLERGWSQEYVAKQINTTRQNISRYEGGIITNLPLERVKALANLFGVPIEEITGWDQMFNIPSKSEKSLADTIYTRLQTDKRFLEIVEVLINLDEEKLNGVQAMLALIK